MKTRTFIALTATMLLVIVGAFSGACKNGGGTLSLDAYFQQLDELDSDLTEKSDGLDAQMEQTEDVDELRGLIGEQIDALEEFLDGLRDLEAPDAVADPHDRAVEGMADFVETTKLAADAGSEATTIDELFAPFNEADFSGLDQATAACVELEQIAADNNIEVDLDCDDETDEPTAEPTTASTAEPSSELEEYYSQLDEAENAYRVQADTVVEALSALEDTQVDEALTHIQEQLDAIDGFVAALQGIDPPPEVAEMHAETIAGFQAVVALIEANMPTLEGAETIAEMDVVFSSAEFTSNSDSLDGACAGLQSIAEANSIAVDLGCES